VKINVISAFKTYEEGKEMAKAIKYPEKAIYEHYETVLYKMLKNVRLGDVLIPIPTKRTFEYTKLLCLWAYRQFRIDFAFAIKKPEPYPNFCDIKQKADFNISMLPDIKFELEPDISKTSFQNKSGIVLIDNVYDTGKTAQAAIETLRKVTDLPISISVIAPGKYYEKGIGYNMSNLT
jgi:hypothetical protein